MIKGPAAISDGKGNFIIDEVEVAGPRAGEVLVRMRAAGVCHTDFDSMSVGGTQIMGHEGAGTVEAVGPGVETVVLGDRVILNWAIPCGHCFQCQRGNQVLCEDHPEVALKRTQHHGSPIARMFRLGTMAAYSVVRMEAITKINIDIPFASASIVGCGVMTGVGSVINAAKVEAGTSVAVLGTGGVGLNVIQGARISGAWPIIAVDVNPERLEMAKQYGATHTVLADRNDEGLLAAAEQVKVLTQGRGADYAFECTAIPSLGAAPLAMVRNAGTAVQVSGIEEELTIDMNLFEWDKVYINPLYGKCKPAIDFPRLLNMYQTGDLLLDELVTRTYPLDQLGQAFDDMHKGINAKGVIVFA
jgi:Zn-dependent alcohol dehydrogenase